MTRCVKDDSRGLWSELSAIVLSDEICVRGVALILRKRCRLDLENFWSVFPMID